MTHQSNATEPHRSDGLREVTRMAWPIMLGAMSFVLMDFVDKVFVSYLDRGLEDPTNLAAIGSAGIWSYTLGVFFVGITGCVSTFVAQSLGRGNLNNCARYAWQGIYVAVAAGIVSLFMLPLADPLFHSMNHAPDVTEREIAYARIRILGFGFVAWQAAIAGFFQAVNRPKIPMYATIAANLANIILDYALIFGKFGLPALGIRGAAIATVLAMILQAGILQSVFLSDATHKEYDSRATWRFQWTKARDLFTIGWPSGVTALLDVAGWSIFTSFIVGGFGTLQLAAHTAAINFMHLMFIPAMALGMAATPIVGQYLGRRDVPTAKARAYTATKLGIGIMISVGLALALSGGQLMRVFSDDPAVISLGHALLILAAVFAGFDAITIVLAGALRGAGDTRWMMVTLTIGAYGAQLPLAWLFSTPLGLEARGAWIGATIYIIGLSGFFLHRFHNEAWRGIKIFSEDREDTTPAPIPEDLEPNEPTTP